MYTTHNTKLYKSWGSLNIGVHSSPGIEEWCIFVISSNHLPPTPPTIPALLNYQAHKAER